MPIPLSQRSYWIFLRSLSLLDWLVLALIGPLLGFAWVAVPVDLLGPVSVVRPDFFANIEENMRVVETAVGLFATGAVLYIARRRLGILASSTVMVVPVAWVIAEVGAGTGGHNLFPFELALFAVLTAIAVGGAACAKGLVGWWTRWRASRA